MSMRRDTDDFFPLLCAALFFPPMARQRRAHDGAAR
jgi:hypothetical protein